MGIEPQTDIFFFDRFGVDYLKSFIIQDDKKMVEKILFGTKPLTRTDNILTLVNIKFILNSCKNCSKKELDNLSDTPRNFFVLYSFFRKQAQTS